MGQPKVMPCPVFEGSEKRLELDFLRGPATAVSGLRCLSRGQIDMLLEKAACCVVSATPSEAFDAYVLSESSLFVYPDKMVLKTCGTTRLLDAVPCILELAAGLAMQPCRCKFSRASYLFPELQPELYQCFAKETGLLESHFGGLGQSCSYVLGEEQHGLQWHIYVASMQPRLLPPRPPTYTLEVCMTELCPAKAAQFSRTDDFVSAKHTTAASGIGSLLSKAQIDDYVFEPCGYSMNGVEGGAFSTIHITPEDGFSYASLELCGYPSHTVDPSGVIAKAVEIFRPGRVTVSLSVDRDAPGCTWTQALLAPGGYDVEGTTFQHFSCGGCLYHYCFQQQREAGGKGSGMVTPSTVLDGLFGPVSSAGEDSDHSSEEYSRSSSPSICNSVEEWKGLLDLPELDSLPRVVKEHKAAVLTSGSAACVEGYMREVIAAEQVEEPLYVVDLGAVARLYQAWTVALPRVAPFYAVKCFPDRAIVATLAAMGAGFDCASQTEMDLVLGLGVSPERIILANCCKRPKDMRRAAAAGVHLTTFDTVSELEKLARLHPGASAVLRIRADDPSARCPLGNKYGAEPEVVAPLFQAAKELGVAVVGVSFHVGSAATNPAAFEEAIRMADRAFALGGAAGHSLGLLDIGGGFSSQCFSQGGPCDIPTAVNRALEAHFPASRGVRIISEPGRYFAEEAATLACMVIGTRTSQPAGQDKQHEYWIADGLYGSMNCLLYDHAVLSAHPLMPQLGAPCHPSTVFGPTCDGLDVVLKDHLLPQLRYGDFIVFEKLGAYSFAGMSDFNGMGLDASNIRYVFSVLP